MSDQFIMTVFHHDFLMNRAGQFSFRKFGKGTGKSRFRRDPRRIFPAAQQTPTRICSQTFNEHLGRGQVEFRFQQKRLEKLLTIQFLPSDTTPSQLRCHEAVWADYFNSSKEICGLFCNRSVTIRELWVYWVYWVYWVERGNRTYDA